jgi:hypothetical protein
LKPVQHEPSVPSIPSAITGWGTVVGNGRAAEAVSGSEARQQPGNLAPLQARPMLLQG